MFGAILYLALSTWARLPYKTTMLIISPIPLLMLVAYFLMMSKPHLAGYQRLSQGNKGRTSISPLDEATDDEIEDASLPYVGINADNDDPPSLRAAPSQITVWRFLLELFFKYQKLDSLK